MAAADGGFDAYFVTEVSDFFKCCVCHFVLKTPMMLIDCGHRLCHCCFEQMKNYSEERKTELFCPLDRKVIAPQKVFPDLGIERQILDMKVNCENVEKNCDWIGELRNLEGHVNADCLYQKIKCVNEGCVLLVERKDLAQHAATCPANVSPHGEDMHGMVKYLTQRLTSCEVELRMKNENLKQLEEKLKNQDKKIKEQDDKLNQYDKRLKRQEEVHENAKLQAQNDVAAAAKTTSKEFEDLLYHSKILSPSHPRFIWTIYNYHEQNKNEDLFSPVFYTSLNGYCCKLSLLWHGQKNGRISIYIHFVRSSNDLILEWPCYKEVIFEIANCNGHVKKMSCKYEPGIDEPENLEECWDILPGQNISEGIGPVDNNLHGPELEKCILHNSLTIQCYFED